MKLPKNLTGSLLVAALGFSKRYQRKAVDLAKIHGVSCYLRGVRLFRQQCLVVLATLFSLILLTAGFIVLPLGVIYYSSWMAPIKMIATSVLAIFYAGIAFAVLRHFFSEARWMEFSKANQLLLEVFKEN